MVFIEWFYDKVFQLFFLCHERYGHGAARANPCRVVRRAKKRAAGFRGRFGGDFPVETFSALVTRGRVNTLDQQSFEKMNGTNRKHSTYLLIDGIALMAFCRSLRRIF